jgi:hypothetical protein
MLNLNKSCHEGRGLCGGASSAPAQTRQTPFRHMGVVKAAVTNLPRDTFLLLPVPSFHIFTSLRSLSHLSLAMSNRQRSLSRSKIILEPLK